MTYLASFNPEIQGEKTPGHREIAELADRQHRVVAVWQLLALGLGRGAIDHRLAVMVAGFFGSRGGGCGRSRLRWSRSCAGRSAEARLEAQYLTGTTGFDVDVPWGQLRVEVPGRPR